MAAVSLAKFFRLIKNSWSFFCPQLLYLPFRDCPRFKELKEETLKSTEFQERLHPYKVRKRVILWGTGRWGGPRQRMKSQVLTSVGGMCLPMAIYSSGLKHLMSVSHNYLVLFPTQGHKPVKKPIPFWSYPHVPEGTRWKYMAGSE